MLMCGYVWHLECCQSNFQCKDLAYKELANWLLLFPAFQVNYFYASNKLLHP